MNINHGINRLLALRGEVSAHQARMLAERPRFQQIAGLLADGGPKAVTGFNLFQTPRPVAAEMARLIRERVGGGRILEPSAGLGRLFEPFATGDAFAEWRMIEDSRECFEALRKSIRRADIRRADFLTQTAEDLGGSFDAVVMNPPFKQGADVKHIEHALGMVREGGRLVSLCYNGAKQNAQLKPIADYWEVLPAHSFRAEGTDADVCLLVIDKKGTDTP